MSIQELIQEIRQNLYDVFAEVDKWFDKSIDELSYRPQNQGWTIAEILEHISLTSHFLLILIEKGTNKALKNINQLDLATELQNYTFEKEKLDEVGIYQSFAWIRPAHMEPKGEKTLPEVRQIIQNQRQECLQTLDKIPNGEGILYRTTMTVNDLGKIDVYEYIYFLAKHAQRHLTQMERNEKEFLKATN